MGSSSGPRLPRSPGHQRLRLRPRLSPPRQLRLMPWPLLRPNLSPSLRRVVVVRVLMEVLKGNQGSPKTLKLKGLAKVKRLRAGSTIAVSTRLMLVPAAGPLRIANLSIPRCRLLSSIRWNDLPATEVPQGARILMGDKVVPIPRPMPRPRPRPRPKEKRRPRPVLPRFGAEIISNLAAATDLIAPFPISTAAPWRPAKRPMLIRKRLAALDYRPWGDCWWL